MIRYPMEGRIGENDVKPVAPGHEAGVQHAEVHAGIEPAGFCYHFRRGVQAGDGCRFLQQSVRQRTGSAAQVQNGLFWIFRYAGEQLPAVFRDKTVFVFIPFSIPVHDLSIVGKKGFFSRKTLSCFHGISPGGALSISPRRAGILPCVGGREMVKISLL